MLQLRLKASKLCQRIEEATVYEKRYRHRWHENLHKSIQSFMWMKRKQNIRKKQPQSANFSPRVLIIPVWLSTFTISRTDVPDKVCWLFCHFQWRALGWMGGGAVPWWTKTRVLKCPSFISSKTQHFKRWQTVLQNTKWNCLIDQYCVEVRIEYILRDRPLKFSPQVGAAFGPKAAFFGHACLKRTGGALPQ